ncbi:MAG TPA: hypothetical protein DCE55_20670 [Planctomycetaceae bacterium]|nr:hypothetical protein [Planctomycetaceae bacterium]
MLASWPEPLRGNWRWAVAAVAAGLTPRGRPSVDGFHAGVRRVAGACKAAAVQVAEFREPALIPAGQARTLGEQKMP